MAWEARRHVQPVGTSTTTLQFRHGGSAIFHSNLVTMGVPTGVPSETTSPQSTTMVGLLKSSYSNERLSTFLGLDVDGMSTETSTSSGWTPSSGKPAPNISWPLVDVVD